MQKLAALLRRAAEALEMTEPEAFAVYLGHLTDHGCNSRPCHERVRLHDAWKAAELRQQGPPPGPGATRAQGRSRQPYSDRFQREVFR